MIRILIADDHAIVRRGLRQVIDDECGGAVVEEAATGQAVLDAVRVELSDDFPMDLFLAIQKGMQVSAARLRCMPSNN